MFKRSIPVSKWQSKQNLKQDIISDIAWSPHLSTCFALVSADGRLEIWNLLHSVLDPAINHNVLDRKLSCVIFSSHSATIVTGDDNGAVTLFKLSSATAGNTSVSGIYSPHAQLSPFDPKGSEWRAEQAQILNNVVNAKKTRVN